MHATLKGHLFIKEVMHVLTQALLGSFNALFFQIKVMLS